VSALLRRTGAAGLSFARELGGTLLLVARTAAALLRERAALRHVLAGLDHFGAESVPVLALTALLTGGILVIQGGLVVRRFGVQTLVGWGVGYGVLRHVGPLLAGLLFNGRVGSRNAAELAAMQTREQLAGLRALGIDPLAAVVAPRAAAMVTSLVLLSALSAALAIAGGIAVAWALLAIEPGVFLRSFRAHVTVADLGANVFKALVFGIAISAVSCRCGLQAQGGAQEVGGAAAKAVVRAALAVIVLDLVVSLP
jgi:phospholipid/cholesterol/gamma-HCH transport system permease protein